MNRAVFKTIKTEFESVVQIAQIQMLGATPIRAIEERTMLDVFCHDRSNGRTPGDDLSIFIGTFVEQA
jgi:hypothetical protein